MIPVLGFASIVCFLVFLALFIIAAIRKSKKYHWGICALWSFIIFCIFISFPSEASSTNLSSLLPCIIFIILGVVSTAFILSKGRKGRPENVKPSIIDLSNLPTYVPLKPDTEKSLDIPKAPYYPPGKLPNIEEADLLEGHAFEYWCADVLLRNGYQNVYVTKGSGDQGADVIAEKDGITYAVQCKCYSSDIGNAAVQQANAGKGYYHRHVGVVMTNRAFTQGAVDAAKELHIVLWDRNKVTEMLQNANSNPDYVDDDRFHPNNAKADFSLRPRRTKPKSLWEENAIKAAKDYLNEYACSYNAIVSQLLNDGYTVEQATYGADNCGADWYEQAIKAAKEYIANDTFSKKELIEQLEKDGFPQVQAHYGASKLE